MELIVAFQLCIANCTHNAGSAFMANIHVLAKQFDMLIYFVVVGQSWISIRYLDLLRLTRLSVKN